MDRAMVQRYLAQRTGRMPRPAVTPEQMRQFFEEQRARRTADSVLVQLRAGGDFAVLARRYSQDGSAQQGGDLGWFREGQMVRPFEAMAFALRPGDLSPVVETEFGFHIIKLEKIRGPERSARHILIRPEITADDVARARQRADSIATALRGGASAAAAAEATETPGDQRSNPHVPVDRLPPAYASLASAEAGQVVGPLEVPAAGGQSVFAVVKVTDKQASGEYQMADVEEQVRERLQEQMMNEEIVRELRATTHIALSL
jgi:peptidyl-prolyl cis-trans isomerase SurA